MEQLTPTQMAAKFDAEHGPASEHDGSWIYYPDGARREVNIWGAYMGPPAEPAERCRAIAYYHRITVARLVGAFDDKKRLYTENASQYSHDASVAELKGLKAEIAAARRALAEAEEAERFARTGRTLEEEATLQQMEADMEARLQQQRIELDGINV